MNAFIDAALSHTRTVLTTMVFMVIAGITSYISIPKEADPDISVPFFYVSVPHPGISPEDAERLLIKPLETELRSLEGLEEITSIGSLGHAGIALEFDIEFDKDEARTNVREKIDLVRPKFPDDTEEPTIHEFNPALQPVIVVTLSGDVPERTLYRHARQLKDEIESIESVFSADMAGHREELLEIIIDPARLESYRITQNELLNTVRLNNRLVAAGSLDRGNGLFSVKVPGLFETRKDVFDLPIKVSGDGVVTLGDIADVRRTFKDANGYARFNGRQAIAIEVTKRIGSNIIENNTAVREAVAKASQTWPDAIQIDFTLDMSDWIFRSLGSLQASITTAILLVMIVCIAALGIRSALLVGIGIPTSFVIGFFFMTLLGMTLNMMMMFGLLLSVGILVDGAIVVVEYADRKMAEGLEKREAYGLAAKRMFWPVASSTATTLAAFAPLLFWPGVSGQFMSYLPITVIIVLSASFITAMIFLPVLGSIFGKTDDADSEVLGMLASAETGNVRNLPGVTGRYIRFLDRLIYHPFKVLLATITILVSTIIIYGQVGTGVEFFVETEPEQAVITVNGRGNLSAQDMLRIAQRVEKIVLATEGVRTAFTRAGTSLTGGGPRRNVADDQIARILIELQPFEQREPGAIILERIRQKTSSLPGIRVEVIPREDGPPTGKDVQLQFTSLRADSLISTVEHVRHYMDNNVEGLIDVEDTRPLPGIEWVLSVDRELAGRFGADITTIGATVQLVTNGILIGRYRPDDAEDEVDIRVRYPDHYRTIDQMDQLRLQTNKGLVPVSSFVTRTPKQELSKLERVDGYRRMMIRANTAIDPETGEKINVNAMSSKIRNWIDTQDIPRDVRVTLRGANEEQQESQEFLGRAMLASLFLMFIILLTQFNSFYHSVITLSTVVLSTIGVLIGLIVTGQTFSIIMSGTGVVALAGIVVNNSIVLIDTFQRLMRDGYDHKEAALRTAGQRLRPIILTTVTTMFGLLPMALQLNVNFIDRTLSIGGPVSVWWVQLATAIIFGLGFSTLITLVLVPVLLVLPVTFGTTLTAFRDKLSQWDMEKIRELLRRNREGSRTWPAE